MKKQFDASYESLPNIFYICSVYIQYNFITGSLIEYKMLATEAIKDTFFIANYFIIN